MIAKAVLIALLAQESDSFKIPTSFKRFNSLKAQTWQEDVDALLNIDTQCDSRRDIALGLIDKANNIKDDVIKAIEDRDIKKLAPPNLKYGKAVAGLQAFQRQLVNDIIPDLLTKTVPKVIEVGPKAVNEIIKTVPETTKELVERVQEISQDASALQSTVDDLRKEVRNIFLSTPEGLETPQYTVEKATDAYEIRKYSSYSVCSTKLAGAESTKEADSDMLDPINSGNGFNVLASYLFGKNIRKEKMSMTTPVIIESGTMEFVLPKGLTTETAPAPETEDIMLKDIPADTVAVREFPGIATEGEVARQRAFLEDSLLSDGILYDNLSFKVLQYNPPYTLPWLRRNEVSVKVTFVSTVDSSSTSTSSSSSTTSSSSTEGATSESSGESSGGVESSNETDNGDASAFFTAPEAGD